MVIVLNKQLDASELPVGARASIRLIGIKILDVQSFAKTMVETVQNTNWIGKLNPLARASYEASSLRTVQALVDIFNSSNGTISKTFGEFMVSLSAGAGLSQSFKHKSFPISEIWQKRLTGNQGFDYYTECPTNLINCGEAKYNKSRNSYGSAASQTCRFIDDQKDLIDAQDLNNFAGEIAITRLHTKRERGFCLAFSVVSEDIENILKNALLNSHVKRIARESESLYLIGIKS